MYKINIFKQKCTRLIYLYKDVIFSDIFHFFFYGCSSFIVRHWECSTLIGVFFLLKVTEKLKKNVIESEFLKSVIVSVKIIFL
jgi:hypothetical protein